MSLVLVTGGTGFLGRYIIERLKYDRLQIRVLARNKNHPQLAPYQNQIEVVEGDLLDELSLEKAFEGVTHVIHSGAVVSFAKKDKDHMKLVNQYGTANIVNYCLANSVKKLVHVSSIAALGRAASDLEFMSEKTKWTESKLNTAYAVSKRLSELEIFRGVEEGLNAVIVNPSMILGAGDWDQGTARFFKMVNKGLKYYPTGSNGFVGAMDVAEACRRLLEAKDVAGKRFVLSAENLSYKELIEMIAFCLNKSNPITPVPAWLAKTAGTLSEFWAKIAGGTPLLTYETAITSSNNYKYDGSLFANTFDYPYTPIKEIISIVSKQFLMTKD